MFGQESPLGKEFGFGGSDQFTVIGVVQDVAHEARGDMGPRVYLTHSQYGTNRNWALTYVVKTSTPASDVYDLARRDGWGTRAVPTAYHARRVGTPDR